MLRRINADEKQKLGLTVATFVLTRPLTTAHEAAAAEVASPPAEALVVAPRRTTLLLPRDTPWRVARAYTSNSPWGMGVDIPELSLVTVLPPRVCSS